MALTHGSFTEAVGADIDVNQLAECRRRLADLPGLAFVRTTDLRGALHQGGYDVVTCMEVLEHCIDAERVRVLDHLRELIAAGGRLVVSVPIEIGPALAGKQFFRAMAAWRGQGDYQYRETYTPRELARRSPGRAQPGAGASPGRDGVRPAGLLRTQRVRLENPRTGNRGEIHRRAAVVHAPGPVRRAVEQPGMVRLRPALDHYFRPLITFHTPRTQRCTYSIGSRTMPCLPTPYDFHHIAGTR